MEKILGMLVELFLLITLSAAKIMWC